MRGYSWPAVCMFGCLAFLLGCRDEPKYDKPLTPVTVHTAERISSQGGTRYSAAISPRTQVDIAFKVGGYISEIHLVRGTDGQTRLAQPGDRVPKETVLARVRESDYTVKLNQAKSNEADAAANFNQAKLDFERAQNLFDSKSLTKSDYDAARAHYQSAQAKWQGAVESRKETEISVHDTMLKAPLDGVIVKRNVELGSLVAAGTVAFVLADTTSIKVVFGVPDLSVDRLRLGQVVTMAAEAIPGAGFQGRITKIDPSADPNSRIFQIEVEIPNPDQSLKPGMIAVVALKETPESADQVAVPLSAIVRTPGNHTGYALYVVDRQGDKGRAVLRPVKLGPVSGNMVVVTDGIKPGDSVIIKGATLIVEGEEVRVVREAG
ncbi:MAG TPA: efflux RND transporter periplasmic adaptor subunit [Nitrospiraceae bacterium]|nr:efflux RND transporter periplasmic adaptor subunit [Nitrospiraceae bacterium]